MVEWLIYPSFSLFLKENIKHKTSLKEARAAYELLGGKRITIVGYCKQVRKAVKAGFVRSERHEQLFLFPSMNSLYIKPPTIEPCRRQLNQPTIEPAHSTHRTLLSMPYAGDQPTKGATYLKPFGRYGTATQSVYRISNLTIVAFRKKLNVWVHRPIAGVRTQEQLIDAKVQGYRALVRFAQRHSLRLEGHLERVLYSHHVVENKALNDALKPLLEAYGEDIRARLGSKICPSSHPGKVEHEGVGRPDRVVRGDQVAAGLEYLTLDYPRQFADFARLVPEYHKQLALHLEVEARTLEAIKELTKAVKSGAKAKKS